MVMISDDFGTLMWRGLLVVWNVLFLTFAISSAAHRNYHALLLACWIRYIVIQYCKYFNCPLITSCIG